MFETMPKEPTQYIVKTDETYERYAGESSGISPRGIPGYGSGYVHVDSDEHDTQGRITERADVRKKMMEKRLGKIRQLQKESIEPKLQGSKDYSILLVGWGSTLSAIEEARKQIDDDRISFLHFSQVYPLHPKTTQLLKKAKYIITIENNATAQFAALIEKETEAHVHAYILQYTGHPFSVENLTDRIPKTVNALEEYS